MTYVTKNYADSGETLVIGGNVNVVSGGAVNVASGGKITAAGTQANHIANAEAAHTVNGTFSNTEIKGFLDALGGKINAIIAVLEGIGATKTS